MAASVPIILILFVADASIWKKSSNYALKSISIARNHQL
jgi:hypothetical protein